MIFIDKLLREAVGRGASDLHVSTGMLPIMRINGKLVEFGKQVCTTEDCQLFLKMADNQQQARFYECGETDFSYEIEGLSRFRINVFKERGKIAVAARVVCSQVPSLDSLDLPNVLKTLAIQPRGLVLVTGPTGSGKSTTLAGMIDYINQERDCHILTLEEPIEFLHQKKKALIRQREVRSDTKSFATGLRAALREDPDVILLGELRDAETMSIAITAAETGHLVLATLHTGNAAQTVERIIDTFPAEQQFQVRCQLAVTIQGVIAQQLVPRMDGAGRVAALEVLIATDAVRNMIREGKTHQLHTIIQSGGAVGMRLMDISLRDLLRGNVISYEDALSRSIQQNKFASLVGYENTNLTVD